MAATTAGFLSLWGASDACCRPYQLVGLDQDEPEVSRDGAGGDEAAHVTIKFERAANSNFMGSRSPATARSRMIFAISVVLAGVRMDDGSDAIAWSKTLPRSNSSSGSNTTPWGDDIDATSPSMRAGQNEIPTAVCSGQGRKRTPKGYLEVQW